MKTNTVNGRHADRAGDDILDFLQLVLEALVSLDDLFAVVVEDLTFTGQAEFFLAALDKQRLEDLLERTDLLADSGLRHLIYLSSLGKTLRLGKVAKHFQAFYLHKR